MNSRHLYQGPVVTLTLWTTTTKSLQHSLKAKKFSQSENNSSPSGVTHSQGRRDVGPWETGTPLQEMEPFKMTIQTIAIGGDHGDDFDI